MVKGKYQQTATIGQPAMERDINCNNIIPWQSYSEEVDSVTAETNWVLIIRCSKKLHVMLAATSVRRMKWWEWPRALAP